jgi:hypothetical protein
MYGDLCSLRLDLALRLKIENSIHVKMRNSKFSSFLTSGCCLGWLIQTFLKKNISCRVQNYVEYILHVI